MTTPQPPRAFCCEPMRGYSTAKCQEHRDEPALCSDVLVVHSERHGPGLPIHVDGGGGMIVIEFCPWCGTRIGDGAGTATPADEEDGTALFATAMAKHGRCTCLPGDDIYCLEERCHLCTSLPDYFPCPTTEHKGYPQPDNAEGTSSAADRVETAAQVLHDRRHRAGTAHTCDRCREDAAAVAAVLTASGETP